MKLGIQIEVLQNGIELTIGRLKSPKPQEP